MNMRVGLSFIFGAVMAGMVLALPVLAESTVSSSPETKSRIEVGGVQIEFEAKKSTLASIPLPRMDEEGLSEAYVPGAFEPTAAGPVATVTRVSETRNDDVLSRYDSSDSRILNEFRSTLARTASFRGRGEFSRVDGNVTGTTQLVSITR